jgi:hypothetical protein
MAIVRKNKPSTPKVKEVKEVKKVEQSPIFTEDEATFLISKLREANYKGTEFETFYKVMSKLAKIAEK